MTLRRVLGQPDVPALTNRRPRTFTSAREAAEHVVRLLVAVPVLVRVYLARTLDPILREHVMVAVSRVNACAGCTAVHERWALRAGVATAELDAIGLGDLGQLDGRSRAAVVYATALTEGRCRVTGDEEFLTAVRRHLSAAEMRGVEAVTRMITLANLTVNGLRTRRGRSPKSQLG